MTAFGYLIPTREAVMRGDAAVAPLLELAQRAEDRGYDSVWVGDSLLARPRHDPLTLLAAIAGRTRLATLGTAVLLPAYRNPVVLAQQLATLDQIAAGRLVVGVGIAADRPNIRAEFQAAGVPFERRVGRMMEGLRLMRALWRGEPVDWNGRWTLTEAMLGPSPHRPGGPPIWGAGSHPNALARAGKAMEGWLPIWPDEPSQWQRLYGIVCDHAKAADRPQPAAAHYLTVSIDDQPRKALERLDSFLLRYYDVPGPAMRRAQACFGGTLEQAADWIQGFVDAGVEHIVLRFRRRSRPPLGAPRRSPRAARLVSAKQPLRVLELGDGIAAAYAARLLSDHGADVVKVEPPEGDPARRQGPYTDRVDEDRSGLFLALNLGKRGVCLDVASGTGKAELAALIAWADVVVHSFRSAEARALGLTKNPRAPSVPT